MTEQQKYLLKEKITLMVQCLWIPLLLGVLSILIYKTTSFKKTVMFSTELASFFAVFVMFIVYSFIDAYRSMYTYFETSILLGKPRLQFIQDNFLLNFLFSLAFSGIFYLFYRLVISDMLLIWPYIGIDQHNIAQNILQYRNVLLVLAILYGITAFASALAYRFGYFFHLALVLAIVLHFILRKTLAIYAEKVHVLNTHMLLIIAILLAMLSAFSVYKQDVKIYEKNS